MTKTAKVIYELSYEMDKSTMIIINKLNKLADKKSSGIREHKRDLLSLQQALISINEKHRNLIRHLLRSDSTKLEIDEFILEEFELGRKFVPSALKSSIARMNAIGISLESDSNAIKPLINRSKVQ